MEEVTRFVYFPGNDLNIQKGDELYEEDKAYFADSTFFDLFSIPLLDGEPEKALSEPNTVVLTQSIARKYFGEENAVGKVLRVQGFDNDLVVSGVCADVPENSHLTFELLLSATGLPFLQQDNYIGFSAFTYLLLKEGASARGIGKQTSSSGSKSMPPGKSKGSLM